MPGFRRILWDWLSTRPSTISSNTFSQIVVLAVLIAHVGVLCGIWYSPRGINWLLSLNLLLASAVLIYAATRLRYIIASKDWPYMGLIIFEFGVIAAAVCALRESRPAVICSCIGFGLHSLASVGAVVFAFTFKINRLM